MFKTTSLLVAHKQAILSALDPSNAIYQGPKIQEQQLSPWRILVYDQRCQSIVSTLFRVGDLRELSITLHLSIYKKRERLPGVTVIYFIEPTEENFQMLCEDFQRELYTSVVINFCTPVSDALLDQFAKQLGKISGAAQKIEKVFEHNLNFTSLNSNLYSLGIPNAYIQKKECHQKLADTLWALISTLKVSPIIIQQQKKKSASPSPQISLNVGQLLINNLKKSHDDDIAEEKPIVALLLLERDDDLNQVLSHSVSYGALLNDIFKFQNNKVYYEEVGQQPAEYDLSPLHDNFWAEAINLPYPEVTSMIDRDLAAWKVKYDKVVGFSGNDDQITSLLNSALDEVPQLQSQKKTLDQHVNIASQIMQHAKQRALDKFYNCGILLAQQGQGWQQSVRECFQLENTVGKDDKPVKDLQYLQELDKMRILALMLLNQQQNQQFYEEYLKLEQIANIKDNTLKQALKYIKSRVGFGAQIDQQQQQQQDQYFLMNKFKGIATKVGKGIKNVSNFLAKDKKKSAIVTILETLFDDIRQQEILEFFKIYDAHRQEYLDQVQLSSVKEIIVCVLEGGSYNEYAELNEFGRENNLNIIYGGSEILNAEGLIKQFTQITQ